MACGEWSGYVGSIVDVLYDFNALDMIGFAKQGSLRDEGVCGWKSVRGVSCAKLQ